MITLAQVQELLNRQNAVIAKIKEGNSGGGLSAVDENAIFEQLSNTTSQLEELANMNGTGEQPIPTEPEVPAQNPNQPFPTEPPVEQPPVIPAPETLPSPENPVNPDNL